jgi:hypothetical protein
MSLTLPVSNWSWCLLMMRYYKMDCRWNTEIVIVMLPFKKIDRKGKKEEKFLPGMQVKVRVSNFG